MDFVARHRRMIDADLAPSDPNFQALSESRAAEMR
jgi:hypothetical protein